jgi:hypothetical protein
VLSGSYSERGKRVNKAKIAYYRSFAGIQDTDWSGANAVWGGVAKDASQTNPGDNEHIFSAKTPFISLRRNSNVKRTMLNWFCNINRWIILQQSIVYLHYQKTKNDTQKQRNFCLVQFWSLVNIWTDGLSFTTGIF